MDVVEGSLWEGVLPGVLRRLYVGRATGRLVLEHADERQGVHFRAGHIVSAESNVRGDRMGELLVASGRLASGELKRAMGFALRDGKRLGIVLVELGLLDADGLEDAVCMHARHVLGKLFAWSEGGYRFQQEAAVAQAGDVTLRLSTGDLILQAARSVQDPDVVRYNLGDIDRRVALSTDPLLRYQHISLSPADGYVLSRVDGSLSAREICSLVPLTEEQVYRSLYGLLSAGVVDFLADQRRPRPAAEHRPRAVAPAEAPAAAAAPGPAPSFLEKTQPLPPLDQRRLEILNVEAALPTLNHFELLRIPRDATMAQVRVAYAQLARRFHPDGHHEPVLSDLCERLERIFKRLDHAHEVLSDPDSRARYEQELDRASRDGSAAAGPSGSGSRTT